MGRRVPDRLHDSIAPDIEKIYIGAIQLTTFSVASENKLTRIKLIDVSISRMSESGQFDTDLETGVSSLVYSTMFEDTITRRTMNQKISIARLPKIVKNTVHGRVQTATVQAGFQGAVRALHDVKTLGHCTRLLKNWEILGEFN